ncbi:MAG: type IV pili methyl-accepting chemotaxis transducer N-terminal domain-containing protein [Planctomycetaceae bacterium]|nr:type IV pili methyl-accepting chemotaxis transducer N-terminal domain-containing protein [Planctomycetaceae bacterium]
MNTDQSSREPLKILQRRFLRGMLAIAVLAMLNQLVLQPWLIQLTADAPTMNVAGRQRMLSQKLSKAALELTDRRHSAGERAPREELQEALSDWSIAHRGLQFGNSDLELPVNESSVIQSAFEDLDPHFQKIQAAAQELISPDIDEATQQRLTDVILEEEGKYLPKMHRIVGLFESESRKRVSQLRLAGWGILLAILILLTALSHFAIQPVMRVIEQRVKERTIRLETMNKQLEQEIDERESAEQRTRQLLDQLAHSSRLNSLGQMAAGLAHELNQPLGAIVNYSETAQCYLEQEPRKNIQALDVLTKISSASLRAGTIVHRLRSFIRKDREVKESVNIRELVTEVVELCSPEARQENVRIEVKFSADQDSRESPVVDVIQTQQVLVNLLQNAMQAMQEVDRTRRLISILISYETEDELRVDVTDRGKGFTTKDVETMFTPFYTTRKEGLGMGLAICRSIISDHGGQFWASSPGVGQGATFSLTLPLVTKDEQTANYLHH